MTTHSQWIEAECVRLLYRQLPAMVAANIINAGLIVVALWHRPDRPFVIAWAGLIGLLSLLRTGLGLLYRHRQPADGDAAPWGRYFAAASTVSGIVWGSAIFLFAGRGDSLSFIAVCFALGGMAAGGVTALSSYLPAFHLYMAVTLLPVEARLLSWGDRHSLALAAMVAMFMVATTIIGHNIHAALVRAMELTEANRRLSTNMERQVAERTVDLEEANARLQDEIAERRLGELALNVARNSAERANHAKSRFLAAASHDLRQPMQSLFLFVQALRSHVQDTKGQEILAMIDRGLDIMKGLLDSLLDISRLDVNLIRPEVAGFPLSLLFEEIAQSYRAVAAGKGIGVHVACPPEIRVRTDRALLGRMLRNLMENAIRYTVKGTVSLSARQEGDVARLEVTDTGIGIPADQLDQIFEEFHQVGNPERDRTQGLGLGLAIVRRLSRLLDHPVTVYSEPGRGSTFSLDVPLDTQAEGVLGLAAPREHL